MTKTLVADADDYGDFALWELQMILPDEEDYVCEDCGGPGATPTLDPYAIEIYGTEVPVVICEKCFGIRSDEV